MDRRTILALVLVAAVIFLTPRLFPRRVVPIVPADSSSLIQDSATTPASRSDSMVTAAPTVAPATSQTEPAPAAPPTDTIIVADSSASFRFSTRGAALLDVDLNDYEGQGARSDRVVRLNAPERPLISLRGIVGRDTVAFDQTPFRIVRHDTSGQATHLTFEGAVGPDTLAIDYVVRPDSYLVRMDARLRGPMAEDGGFMLLRYAPTLESYEADSVDDHRHLGFAWEVTNRGSKGTAFQKLDPDERQVIPGPLTWVALKNKYFIVGVLARDSLSPMAEFIMTGGQRASKVATLAQGTAVIQPRSGSFSLDIYAGPQQVNRLRALGRDFVNSNPYGGFLQPVVQPFAGIVLRVLLWMRHTIDLSYGWVLVIFGVAVRLILWPLNHSAMRNSIKMQRIQPELQALQTKYKSDPQKLQSEMMKVYKSHDMSPFSMFSGCLPLLLPMPILFALFFVFQSTIEFRGVSFLWLADISQKDPFYILPLVMGVSMFFLSWIGARNAPPNPQTKMMSYVLPVVMTFLLANLAAGLNLYYAVQNLAALPQQWLIANERARSVPKS